MKTSYSETFKDYVVDQLSDLGSISVRKMFGSFGLYCNGKFFAIISAGQLYFKTNPRLSILYTLRGMHPFTPSKDQVLKNYYQVPPDIIDDRIRLPLWAEEAIKL